jgi:acyl-CoA reductase-like NAD-dependent aldehyde dehydrogenase
MSFQAGCPHARIAASRAIAYAWDAAASNLGQSLLGEAARKERAAENGKAVQDRCRAAWRWSSAATPFPTWNGYSGMFASLATGNAVIVKPHPNAIPPLAITVQIARRARRSRVRPEYRHAGGAWCR